MVAFALHHPKGGGGSASAVTRSMARLQGPVLEQRVTFAPAQEDTSVPGDTQGGDDDDPDPYPELEEPTSDPVSPPPFVTPDAGDFLVLIMTRDEIMASVH